MIARIWRGATRADQADQYVAYLEATGLRNYRATPGNLGVRVLRRIVADRSEFVLIAYWESWDAIRAFAGPTPEIAVYYPEDDALLLEKEPTVAHYEVVVRS